MTKEEWIKIYHAKDGIWDKDDLIDRAYEIITSPIRTNYDRIKSMSVEEMAEILYMIDQKRTHNGGGSDWDGMEKVKKWLLQEVSEDE